MPFLYAGSNSPKGSVSARRGSFAHAAISSSVMTTCSRENGKGRHRRKRRRTAAHQRTAATAKKIFEIGLFRGFRLRGFRGLSVLLFLPALTFRRTNPLKLVRPACDPNVVRPLLTTKIVGWKLHFHAHFNVRLHGWLIGVVDDDNVWPTNQALPSQLLVLGVAAGPILVEPVGNEGMRLERVLGTHDRRWHVGTHVVGDFWTVYRSLAGGDLRNHVLVVQPLHDASLALNLAIDRGHADPFAVANGIAQDCPVFWRQPALQTDLRGPTFTGGGPTRRVAGAVTTHSALSLPGWLNISDEPSSPSSHSVNPFASVFPCTVRPSDDLMVYGWPATGWRVTSSSTWNLPRWGVCALVSDTTLFPPPTAPPGPDVGSAVVLFCDAMSVAPQAVVSPSDATGRPSNVTPRFLTPTIG
ncbi:hypothetical protein BURPSS13_G0066 [Burkholderia pseudomallei S13]|nr:hypothetical protein BURPSS13_G0066 [Burkholderia pseudomallei S13]